MGSFTSTLTDENDEEFDVEVEYNEGYFRAGCRSGHPDNWTPDEGEDPEITSVKDIDGNEIIDKLDSKTMRSLTDKAWEHQNEAAEPDDCYYDDEPYDDSDDWKIAQDQWEKDHGI